MSGNPAPLDRRLACIGSLLQQLNAQEAAAALMEARALLAEHEALLADHAALVRDWDELQKIVERIRPEVDRYRWLRDESGFLALPYTDHGCGPEFPTGADLDAAIDAARQGA